MSLEPTPWWRYMSNRLIRHAGWARTEGLGRLVAEDRLDPIDRTVCATRRWRWRRHHAVPRGSAQPIFVVGVQRSGTNMLLRGLGKAPEFEVRNENDRKVFRRFVLRSDETVAGVIRGSRHRYVVFKPLCDSHRVTELLTLPGTPAGRAVWLYRDVDERARSAVAKFGDANLRALRRIAAGQGHGMWQAERLSHESLELLRDFDYTTMTSQTAAALFWYVRNRLFFELGLDQRTDVLPFSYEALVNDPEVRMRQLCDFIGFPYRPQLVTHIRPRTVRPHKIDIDPRVRQLCDELAKRLDTAALASGLTSA
jgi:hypothetical protein